MKYLLFTKETFISPWRSAVRGKWMEKIHNVMTQFVVQQLRCPKKAVKLNHSLTGAAIFYFLFF